MYKNLSKILAASILIWIANSFADAPFVDLHRGTMVIPCLQVQLADESITVINLRLNQRGSAFMWQAVAADADIDRCVDLSQPFEIDKQLSGKPEDDTECISRNSNANNCGTKEEDGEEEDGEEEEESEDDDEPDDDEPDDESESEED